MMKPWEGIVRALKLSGKDAIYCCADDTHGTPIQIKADQLKISPEELIEKVHKEHLEDFKAFLINFDSYYSTNSEENKHFADKIFTELKNKQKDKPCPHCKAFGYNVKDCKGYKCWER